MFTRGLSLKLIAPTVLLSALLACTCVLVALYLNRLHVNVSEELRENFKSTQAADNLETAVRELMALLRDAGPDAGERSLRVTAQLHTLRQELLPASEELANRDEELKLAARVRAGLDDFAARWESR